MTKFSRPLFLLKLAAVLFAVACSKTTVPARIGEPVKIPGERPAASWCDSYSALLARYVSRRGVAYAEWKGNRHDLASLRDVVDGIAAANVDALSRDEQLAFYLNAYNAWILHRILQDYPVTGPGNGGALKRALFFKGTSIRVGGRKMSFSSLENDIIRPQFREPRIHFALNCASASCPPLHHSAFSADTLDRTLTMLTRDFVTANPRGVRTEPGSRKVLLSKIFEWYGEDFAAAGGPVPYINRFRDAPLPADSGIGFMEYDWSLNEG